MTLLCQEGPWQRGQRRSFSLNVVSLISWWMLWRLVSKQPCSNTLGPKPDDVNKMLSVSWLHFNYCSWCICKCCVCIMTRAISLVQVPASLIGAIIGWKPKLKSTSLCFLHRSFGTEILDPDFQINLANIMMISRYQNSNSFRRRLGIRSWRGDHQALLHWQWSTNRGPALLAVCMFHCNWL